MNLLAGVYICIILDFCPYYRLSLPCTITIASAPYVNTSDKSDFVEYLIRLCIIAVLSGGGTVVVDFLFIVTPIVRDL